ncbi:hypothetical protein BDW22DRAFT_1351109 [Trametopsis cervina]|nr:hypothetical protein BDW22DRAFT_1351109 [Trametopsis cervina]
MSDIPRQSSPRTSGVSISSSPSRPSPLSRPHWPNSTYTGTHRSSSSASSLTSLNSTAMSPGGSGWEGRSAAGTPSPSGLTRKNSNLGTASGATVADENTRHWSFNAFEWVVRDVHRLRDHVELPEQDGATADISGFEILNESPMLADGKFKLEIAKPSIPEAGPAAGATPSIRTQPPSLSLYITSVMLEYAHSDYEISSSMFTGIKCQDDRVGERGARPDWAWEFWQNDWVFREDSEVWECPLPTLSSLLENPRIKATDSFVICVQIHCPIGPFFPHQPSASYVPRNLLDGLEAMLDNANTGDVQFICLERREDASTPESAPSSPATEIPSNRRPPSSASDSSTSTQTYARKRIIYAHSDILIRRSEYFATMFNSSFSENAAGPISSGERKVYTVVVEEADFVTIFWLLKWVYANWLLFRENDNPKNAVDGIGEGWSTKSLDSSKAVDEWAWTVFGKGEAGPDVLDVFMFSSETRSAASAETMGDKGKRSTAANQNPSSSRTRVPPSPKAQTSNALSSSRPPPSPTRRVVSGPSAASGSATLTVPSSGPKTPSSPRGSNVVPLPAPINTSSSGLSPNHPLSPLKQRQRSRASGVTADPHPHPTPPPPPASALSMYQVAHRYTMPGLASLSLEHMMSTITPQSSFALLLASTTWDELHGLVEDYVVDKWDEVSVSTEFEQCCQEVAAGEWGPEGGKTLMALFRRLRSPMRQN